MFASNFNYLYSLKWVVPTTDNKVFSFIRGAYFHELSHAIAMKLLFSGVQPHIYLSRNRNYTVPLCWDRKSLTSIGKIFGFEGSKAIVSAAGPLMDCFTDIALDRFAESKKMHSFNFFLLIKVAQSFCVFANASYAFKCGFGANGDYTKIKNYTGISPFVPAAGLSIRLLFVLKSIFHRISYTELKRQ